MLLDNIMLRLGKLESKVENIYNGTGGNLTNGTSTATPSATNSEKVNVAGMYSIFTFAFKKSGVCACRDEVVREGFVLSLKSFIKADVSAQRIGAQRENSLSRNILSEKDGFRKSLFE